MSKKHDSINTIDPGPVGLNEEQIAALDSIVKNWNISKHVETPEWDVKTVLAKLAVERLQQMLPDYGPTPRKPDYEVEKPPPPFEPLDPSTLIV